MNDEINFLLHSGAEKIIDNKYCKIKFFADYSKLFDAGKIMEKDEIDKNHYNVKGRYSREIYKKHIDKYGVSNIRK